MKKENNYYLFMIMIAFITCFIVSFVLADKTIEVCGLMATASVVIYPLTYFLATLFCERYGKNKTFNMFVYAVFALIFATVLTSLASLLPIASGDFKFVVDYRLMFALITAFVFGHALNLIIYYYLDRKRKINFFVSGIISITFDSLIFVLLGYLGSVSYEVLFKLFSGQYIISVIIMAIYTFLFGYIIPSVIDVKTKEEPVKEVKKPTKKTSTTKKSTTTKKTAK